MGTLGNQRFNVFRVLVRHSFGLVKDTDNTRCFMERCTFDLPVHIMPLLSDRSQTQVRVKISNSY